MDRLSAIERTIADLQVRLNACLAEIGNANEPDDQTAAMAGALERAKAGAADLASNIAVAVAVASHGRPASRGQVSSAGTTRHRLGGLRDRPDGVRRDRRVAAGERRVGAR